jgi:ABC-type multidrug transport system fused ATPase/permease subunit
VFENYHMRYRPETELVLKGVNFAVKSGEKVGIVGRTGSGKSTVCLSLFRVIEAAKGRILIDDVDISKVGLDILRSRMCVIPQDPTLFKGTLRENLDPFKSLPTQQLLNCLQSLEIFQDVSQAEILSKQVEENGSNFSVGERQLICIARAILRNSKIMFLDEATASIDYRTDELIQKIIRQRFTNCTVLTIAHRLNTIMDYDRILVLNEGIVAEFGTPQELVEMRGIFYNLVQQHKTKG